MTIDILFKLDSICFQEDGKIMGDLDILTMLDRICSGELKITKTENVLMGEYGLYSGIYYRIIKVTAT